MLCALSAPIMGAKNNWVCPDLILEHPRVYHHLIHLWLDHIHRCNHQQLLHHTDLCCIIHQNQGGAPFSVTIVSNTLTFMVKRGVALGDAWFCVFLSAAIPYINLPLHFLSILWITATKEWWVCITQVSSLVYLLPCGVALRRAWHAFHSNEMLDSSAH